MMKFTTACAFLSLLLYCAANTHAVTFDWATVGNPGNAGELKFQGTFGAVAETYRIGTTEVTNAQYADFLNAVDPTGANSLGLYSSHQAGNFGGIENTGTTDGLRYLAQTGREQNPVTYVSWYDTIRFINWLHNGQGSGDTESGAYTLLGGTAIPSNGPSVTRESNAMFWLPSENEWYKAAYHDASAGTAGTYFEYATGSDTTPTSDQPADDPAAVNYFNDNAVVDSFNDGYAVSGSRIFPTSTNPYTDVGAYTAAASPYGTFDQNGNVSEWNETLVTSSARGIRGGDWNLNTDGLLASIQLNGFPASEVSSVGFRVASIPEPNSLLLGAVVAGGVLVRRRHDAELPKLPGGIAITSKTPTSNRHVSRTAGRYANQV